MATYQVGKGKLGSEMPKVKQRGTQGKRVQGGHAPMAFRSRTTSWATANTRATEPVHRWSRETIWDFKEVRYI
jgi:hypothetical protein